MILQNRALIFSALVAMIVWSGWFYWGGSFAFQSIVENWRITLTMVFASIVAGMTSEGGGAVAFPIFTKVLHIPPGEARIFSLAIQSIGMTAASLTIVFMKLRVQWKVIMTAGFAGIFGLLASTFFLIPLVSAPLTKISFTVMVATLAIALIIMNKDKKKVRRHQNIPEFGIREIAIFSLTGFIGGAMSGLVGCGIDIITFMVMVLLFRLDEKIATPTTVVLMTTNTIVGFALHALVLDTFTPTIQSYWLAAIPVVCVGAPFGAWLCSIMNRTLIVYFLISLIAVEVISTVILIPMSPMVFTTAFITLLICGAINGLMCRTRFYCPSNERYKAKSIMGVAAEAV